MAVFKIGDFSRLTRVSMKTLRHYDDIGLFKPAQVDRFTGYRYYTFDQLPRLNRILVLKGLGFSLDDIRQMVDGDLDSGELRGMLRLRRAQLQRDADEALEKLQQIEIRLKQIEQEGHMLPIDVLLKQVEPLTIAGAREVVPSPAQMRERCIALDKQVCELIEAADFKTDGVSFALYYSDEDAGIDVEMAYAVEAHSAAQKSPNQASIHILPAATVAYVVYTGSYDDFGAVGQIHGALHTWIAENGYQLVSPSREWYLRPPSSANDPQGVMEIQYPVEKLPS
jgi:DNA-binding transcriptional MerR regulator